MFQGVAGCSRVLQWVAVGCSGESTKNRNAAAQQVCCSVLQCVAVGKAWRVRMQGRNRCVAASCSVWQCVVACCSVLQGVAAWCSVLQCVAMGRA